jgi:hypothetical protein
MEEGRTRRDGAGGRGGWFRFVFPTFSLWISRSFSAAMARTLFTSALISSMFSSYRRHIGEEATTGTHRVGRVGRGSSGEGGGTGERATGLGNAHNLPGQCDPCESPQGWCLAHGAPQSPRHPHPVFNATTGAHTKRSTTNTPGGRKPSTWDGSRRGGGGTLRDRQCSRPHGRVIGWVGGCRAGRRQGVRSIEASRV